MRLQNLLAPLLILLTGSVNYAQAQRSSTDTPDTVAAYRKVLNSYCVTCHNETLKTAGLMLDKVDPADLGQDPQLWEKVLLKMQTRSMPPVGMPRPEEPFYVSFAAHLENTLNSLVAANPNPGRTVAAHRLNRAEYTNAIRDLLGVTIDGASMLPADNSGEFDNLGESLSVSEILLEKYMAAAREISRLAIGDISLDPNSSEYTVSHSSPQNERMNENLPFGTRGGLAVRHRFPLDGEYKLSVRLQRTPTRSMIIGLNRPHRIDFRLDGKRVKLFTIGGDNVGLALGVGQTKDAPDLDQDKYEHTADNQEIRFTARAGEKLVQLAFLEENFAWEEPLPPRNYKNAVTASEFVKDSQRAWVDPSISYITITGPFNVKGPGQTASREKIFICTPTGKKQTDDCANRILSNLARQAYRRPVDADDIEPLLGLYRQGSSENGSFEAGIQMALEGLLVSTEFLFRIAEDPVQPVKDDIYAISNIDLASRLSFFLWSSIPDQELLEVAEQGRLKQPEVLEQQVRRMLEDDKSMALVNNFSVQWLLLRNLPHTQKSQQLFPEFDDNLREYFQTESELFISSIFREDRPILDLFRADYKYLNERLAQHYGIPDVYGKKFRRVTVTDENKKGLLAQGAVLAITSYPNRTSPVLRGKWVLENILAAPPPPPPASIPALKEEDDGGKPLSMREAIERHRANPVCAVCHNRMDPIGFGLENFNPIGQWRTEDAGAPIDSSGMLPDGSKFQGPAELQQALLSQSRVIASAFTRKLLTYALGRDLEYYDMPAVRKIVDSARESDYRFSDIVLGIVNSLPFQMRRTNS